MESSDSLASSHKTFTYHRQYYSRLTFLFYGIGGVKILWYDILTPPPPRTHQILKKGILTLEYSVNLASLLRTCKYLRQF